MRSALDEFKKSGLSLYAFARERRIPYATLRYWKCRADPATDPNRSPVRFLEARPTGRMVAPEILEISVDSRITLRVAAHIDPQLLRRLVLALTAPC